MFEDATFESSGRIRTRSRRWMVAALLCNGTVLLAMIVIPLIYPEALPRHMISILMEVPLTQPELPKPQPLQLNHSPNSSASFAAQASESSPRQRILTGITLPRGTPNDTPSEIAYVGLDSGPALPNGSPFGAHPGPAVVSGPKGPMAVSTGVSLGMLIAKIPPSYPVIARTAGIQGTVVLEAIISKSGTIENLRVVSGPMMLQQAALDAVKRWRYRPYLLNGQAVEVETTVSVDFRMER
jgi:protein TonB